jgi:hypothetical protein
MGSTCNYWIRVKYNVRVTHTTNNVQDIHELVSSVHRDLLSVTLVRIHVEGTGTGIDDDTGQILITFVVKGVVRGVVLILVHGWSVLNSLIIGHHRVPVKMGCASSSTVHQVLEVGVLNCTLKLISDSLAFITLTNLHSICPGPQVKFFINLLFYFI